MNPDLLVRKASIYLSFNRYKASWEDVCNYLGIKYKPSLDLIPVTYLNVTGVFKAYVESVLREEEHVEKIETGTIKDIKTTLKLGRFTLSPEQQWVYDKAVQEFYGPNNKRALYCDGVTGIGKTLVAVALMKYVFDNNIGAKHISIAPRVLVVTSKTVVELWYRHIEDAGLGHLVGSEILVVNYSALISSEMSIYLEEDNGDYVWRDFAVPHLLILDEAHMLNRDSSQRHKVIMSILNHDVKIFCLSATPWTTVNDAKLFACAARAQYHNVTANYSSFATIANSITKEPDKPNKAAAERLREWLAPYIVSFPRVPWKHKAVNATLLVDFASEAGRIAYEEAYERFLERYHALGKKTNFGRWELAVALNQFRYAAEPLRMEQIVELALKQMDTHAPVIGCAFKKSIVKGLFRVVEAGLTRDQVSIIWGGHNKVDTSDYLTEEQLEAIFKRIVIGEEISDEEMEKVRTTLDIKEAQLIYEDMTPEETIKRLNMLEEWGLSGTQSIEQRQVEIDKFQQGKSLICFMTIASGGVGLSLDRWKEELKPRVGYFTPTYSGYEMRQLLGRLVRRFTVGDVTYQYIVGLRNTVEETHVLPKISEKLACLAKVTNNDIDVMKIFKSAGGKLRTIEDAIREIENTDTQLYGN